jgi:hypothetical protein
MSEDRPPSDLINSSTGAAWLRDKIVSVDYDAASAGGPNRISAAPVNATRYLHLQFVNVFVRDQERSMHFFVDRLGFILVRDVRFASGNRFIQVAPPDGTAGLALVQPRPELGEDVWSVIAHR